MTNTLHIAGLALAIAACGAAGERAIDPPAKRSFAPQYPLWTDGATKRRFIELPAGAQIDASNPDAWQLPVGARLTKEFYFGGVLAETRAMERTASGWQYSVVAGEPALAAPGVPHVVPKQSDCRVCHIDGPLGFSALQLSPDRDPNAAHREPRGEIDLATLLDEERLASYRGPAAPRIAGSPTQRAALGYLHGNCGGCHNPRTALSSVELVLASSVSGGDAVIASVVGVPSRIVPGKAREHVLLERMQSRSPVMQMPPLGTQLVDREGVELVSAWIAEQTPNH